MRKLILSAAAVVVFLISGCAQVSLDVTMETIYSPPLLGDRIGDVVKVVDHKTGATVFYRIDRHGTTVLASFVDESEKR